MSRRDSGGLASKCLNLTWWFPVLWGREPWAVGIRCDWRMSGVVRVILQTAPATCLLHPDHSFCVRFFDK